MSGMIEYLDKRLDRIEDKVDHLIKFKWQILGGAAVIGTLTSVVVSVILLVIFGGH